MKRMIALAAALAAAVVLPTPTPAAEPVVSVKALLSRDAVHPGETVKAALVLTIRPGFHVNDDAPDDPFLFPTSLAFNDAAAFEVAEIAFPKGRRAKFAYSETELVVYEGQAVVGVLLKVRPSAAAGPAALGAVLSYQACDNTSCQPPAELAFDVPVEIVPAGRATKETNAEVFAKLEFKGAK